uniref:Uncharacterized protein n=1 Tax=Chromera velia CCMP2878 TaxID=1169474 RepID=A0A0G4GPJ3_9ALVE|eukprot:Cvel_22770.t1-p1 / transcript=Cvel_22770.t1 / gene=Cvel_22770 / organism=Chromera_velia_CCMP2878 / gene_product=hypothetical protein / transcript_product=hypothetical protein / location=Cvel_scaffold2275:21360-22427(+) / protein_length=272 / sequence_SO=supercontig / SO=protein_coding / is_pseudo=false
MVVGNHVRDSLDTLQNRVDSFTDKVTKKGAALTKALMNLRGMLTARKSLEGAVAGYSSFMVPAGEAARTVDLQKVFQIFDTPRAIDGPSSWKMSHGLVQSSKIGAAPVPADRATAEFIAGTFAAIRNKRVFDGAFSTKFFAVGTGSFGIAFRFKNPENHYLLEFRHGEIRNDPKGIVRVVRVKEGKVSEMTKGPEDGGFLSSATYKVTIISKKHSFDIVIEGLNEKGEAKETRKLSFSDSSFGSGTFGFFTNGMESVTFDEIDYKAAKCVGK